MDIILISIVALVVSGLTFFSGFGLGTLLMPAFAIFFPIEAAIAATAVVHLANNIFKLSLVGKFANYKILVRFAVTAAIFAALGAWVLNYLSDVDYLFKYHIAGNQFYVTPIKLIIALLMIFFSLFEVIPKLKNYSFPDKYIPFGGMLSGFFGGVSGHQGALRTAFLVRTGMEKKELIGTMVFSAVIIDISRLLIYGVTFFEKDIEILKAQGGLELILWGSGAAFIGTIIGRYLLEKVTLKGIQITVAVMLFILALGLASGII